MAGEMWGASATATFAPVFKTWVSPGRGRFLAPSRRSEMMVEGKGFELMSREAAFRAARRRQSEAELARKAAKARRRQNIWTVEEIDLAAVQGVRLAAKLRELMR